MSVSRNHNSHLGDIGQRMEGIVRDPLAADPGHCQVIVVKSCHRAPDPVLVDRQSIAKPHRTPAAITIPTE